VPDERVGGVRRADRGIARERVDVERHVREARVRHLRDRRPEADRGPGQHEPGELRAPGALREARRDQTAHGVTEQDHREPGMGGPRALDHLQQVVDHVLDVRDQHALARGQAVSEVVRPVDRGAARARARAT
jgi:hypothetical protein